MLDEADEAYIKNINVSYFVDQKSVAKNSHELKLEISFHVLW